MSDLQIEKAAMGPRRWIGLCDAFEKNLYGAILYPRSTRSIDDSFATPFHHSNNPFFLVPGGRYLVRYALGGISVLDLGFTSSADCKLIASVGLEGEYRGQFKVQVTPDGMGLTILIHNK